MNQSEGLVVPVHPEPEGARLGLLMVGNFLSSSGGRRGVCEDLADRLREAGWPVRTTSSRIGRLPRTLEMIWSVLFWRDQYDVAQVDVYSGAAFLWAAATVALLYALGKPCVLSLHGGNLPALERRWPNLVRKVLQTAAVVTAPSSYLVREMSEARRDIRMVPNSLDLPRYQFIARSNPAPRLIWLRAFHAVYDPESAPAVLALVLVEFPEATLTMIGPDKGDGSLARTRATGERLGVSSRLKIVEGVPKQRVGEVLNLADIFLNTTTVDNAPVSVAEAMACGLCIVSTNAGGIPDLIEDGTEGLLVPSGDAAAMAAAVICVLRDGSLAARLSRAARRRAEGYGETAVLNEWDRILREAARVGVRD